MDNDTQAPVIPFGTGKTVYGGAAFQGQGQAQVGSPLVGKPPVETQGADLPVAPDLDHEVGLQLTPEKKGTSYDELAARKGFQSPDDLARSYAELESHNKKVEMSLAELAHIREQQQAAPASVIPQKVETQEDAVKVVENIVRKAVRPLEDRLELQNLFMKNTDAKDYANQMAEVIKQNPGVSWDVAYKLAKFDSLSQKSKEEGKKEAYQAIQQKQAVVAGGSRPVTVKSERSLQDLISDKNVSFKEVQRVMKERFSQ